MAFLDMYACPAITEYVVLPRSPDSGLTTLFNDKACQLVIPTTLQYVFLRNLCYPLLYLTPPDISGGGAVRRFMRAMVEGLSLQRERELLVPTMVSECGRRACSSG